MRYAFVLPLLLAATTISAWGQATNPPPTARPGSTPPRVVSPEVSAEQKLTFRVYAPKAEAVRLNGGDLGNVGDAGKLTKGTNGVWETTLGQVDPGTYRYTFDVDAVTVVDPSNPSTSESNDTTWSLVYVPGREFMDTQPVPHGSVASVTYHSSSLNRFRRMHVYTPPHYELGEGRFPVFYLLHGASDSDASWSTIGRAGFVLDNLIAAGKAKPMIIVMPAGHTGPFRQGSLGGRTEFEGDFVRDIMPYVEANYRTQNDRAHRAMAGLSMGGGQTLNIGMPNLDKFGYLGVFSSGVRNVNTNTPGAATWEERNAAVLDDPELKEGLKLFWFATGKEDFVMRSTQSTMELLRRHDFDIEYHESAGGHTWRNWREYLNLFAPLLFQ